MSNLKITNSLISILQLKDNLSAENLILLDASMKLVGIAPGPTSETAAYIPGSLRFDFDNEIRDHNTPLPHMMPSAEFFTDEMQKMGINQESTIVVYDRVGIYSSPRAWWMFRAMGHTQVAVLDGGLPAWTAAGFETVPQLREKPAQRGNFIGQQVSGAFVNADDVMHALNDASYSVLDARSAGRFKGLEPEPREGLKPGHMPNAFNIPFTSVLENGVLKDTASLRSIFEAYKNRKMIFSCGSGATACVLALAAEQAGHKDLSVYDGSWSEWGLISSNRPAVTD